MMTTSEHCHEINFPRNIVDKPNKSLTKTRRLFASKSPLIRLKLVLVSPKSALRKSDSRSHNKALRTLAIPTSSDAITADFIVN